jgi:tRNA-specific 2-thiouridylase
VNNPHATQRFASESASESNNATVNGHAQPIGAAVSSASAPIVVAVSGGADSLYSLILMREQGLAPIALHGIFFAPRDETEAARRAEVLERLAQTCRSLDVPLIIRDFSEPFLQLVIRPFVESYAQGQTPNPCALCNARVKFGLLQDAAQALGSRLLVTGHYARREHSPSDPWPVLLQGDDDSKDQSYFLSLVPAQRLARAVFPLGDRHKRHVLQTLQDRGIAVPQPGESQEVCFVPRDEYRDYLPGMARQLGIRLPGPGPMLLTDGRRLGTHKGLWRYTEGQRKGLGVGWSEPLHVLGKELNGNVLRLGARQEMGVAECLCRSVNILLPPEQWPAETLVKTRYREQPKPARVTLEEDAQGETVMRLRFARAENAVAPGQIGAVYIPCQNALRLVAGGVITLV